MSTPLPESGAKGAAVWVQYSKERYDAAEKRIADFRGWARQLAAAIGVVIGLEAALVSQLTRPEGMPLGGLVVCLVVLLGSVAFQLAILGRTVARGYVGKSLSGPESPVVLADHVSDEASTRQMIGAYYAKASDEAHATAEEVARDVGRLARHFVWSLWFLFAGMVLTAGLQGVSSLPRKTMANTPASDSTVPSAPASDATPATPAQAPSLAPSKSPLLATPTTGRPETRGAQPSRQDSGAGTSRAQK